MADRSMTRWTPRTRFTISMPEIQSRADSSLFLASSRSSASTSFFLRSYPTLCR